MDTRNLKHFVYITYYIVHFNVPFPFFFVLFFFYLSLERDRIKLSPVPISAFVRQSSRDKLDRHYERYIR